MDSSSQPDEILAKVRSWLAVDEHVSMADDGVVTVAGRPRTEITATSEEGALVLTHRYVERGAAIERADRVRRILEGPTETIEVSLDDDANLNVTISRRIPGSALGRHTLLGAVHGIAGLAAASGLGDAAPDAGDAQSTRLLERVWSPTHVVPAGGLPAWPTPDGSQPAPVRLEERVELAVAERRSDWARVVGENGWSGWVDGRRLVPNTATPAGPRSDPKVSPRSATLVERIRPMPLIGLFTLGVGAVLPWLNTVTGSLGALEVPIAFLWNVEAAEPPALAWLLLVLAAAAAALAFTGVAPMSFIPLGLAVVAVPLLFIVQVYQGVIDAGDPAGSTFSLVGLGPLVVLISGFLLLASTRR